MSHQLKKKKNQSLDSIKRIDLANKVFDRIGFSKKQAEEYVDLTFDILKEGIQENKMVMISKFGTFKVQKKKAKKGRNPSTGEKIIIPPHKSIHFKPSLILKELINKNKE